MVNTYTFNSSFLEQKTSLDFYVFSPSIVSASQSLVGLFDFDFELGLIERKLHGCSCWLVMGLLDSPSLFQLNHARDSLLGTLFYSYTLTRNYWLWITFPFDGLAEAEDFASIFYPSNTPLKKMFVSQALSENLIPLLMGVSE